jgi:4-hydroxy-tetrahydrodipicolinate reductase
MMDNAWTMAKRRAATVKSGAVEVAIAGAAGRMGQRLVALAGETPGVKLVGAFEQEGHPSVGSDSGQTAGAKANGVRIVGGAGVRAQVIIDFTTSQATRQLLKLAVAEDIALVIGTTGLTAADHAAIDQAARSVAIVQAPNMSLGVNLLLNLVAQTARQLGDDYDVEILEAHHRFKKDAPSGTAMGLAESICAATGKNPRREIVYTRHGREDLRNRGKITMQTLRMGDVVGEHTVFFCGLGERLELTHRAGSRDTFARGALRAAMWLKGRKPGRYTMQHVLGL